MVSTISMKRADHDFLQSRIHFFGVPRQALLVLHPLEIADGHAAGVRQDVGQHGDAARARISSACGVVGPLAASATMRALIASALCSVMTFSSAAGTRMSHFMVSSSSLRDARCAGHADDGAGALLVTNRFDRIDAARIGDAAARVADRDDLALSSRAKRRAAVRAGVAESLNGDGRAAQMRSFSACSASSTTTSSRARSLHCARRIRRWKPACRSPRRARNGPRSSRKCP